MLVRNSEIHLPEEGTLTHGMTKPPGPVGALCGRFGLIESVGAGAWAAATAMREKTAVMEEKLGMVRRGLKLGVGVVGVGAEAADSAEAAG